MPLSATQVRNAKAGPRPQKLFDGRGLYLEIPTRGNKRWRFRYRFERREKLISLGLYPEISLQVARERREDARRLLAHGVDPSAERQARRAAAVERAAHTFEPIAREWFERHAARWAASHRDRLIRRLERDAFPWLGARPITEIRAPELLAVARRVEARGAAETAHRILQTCGQVFRFAVATGRAERDPTTDLRGALPPPRKGRMAALTDPEEVGALLRAIDGYAGTLVVRCALRLAPLVFVRPGELRHAAWADIKLDAEQPEWRFNLSKAKQVEEARVLIVPLARQAVEILREIRPLTGQGKYVFPSARSPRGNRPLSDNALLVALRSLGFTKEQMSVHGFRALARTLLAERGVLADMAEIQLGHKVPGYLGDTYNRVLYLDERVVMMQEWADYLDELRGAAACPSG